MSGVRVALENLDEQIATLQTQIDPKRPERDPEAFALIRALSLGRTFLRSIPEDMHGSWREIDEIYKLCRTQMGAEEPPEPSLILRAEEEL